MFIEANKKQHRAPSGATCLFAATTGSAHSVIIALLTECGASILLRPINMSLLAECRHSN